MQMLKLIKILNFQLSFLFYSSKTNLSFLDRENEILKYSRDDSIFIEIKIIANNKI